MARAQLAYAHSSEKSFEPLVKSYRWLNAQSSLISILYTYTIFSSVVKIIILGWIRKYSQFLYAMFKGNKVSFASCSLTICPNSLIPSRLIAFYSSFRTKTLLLYLRKYQFDGLNKKGNPYEDNSQPTLIIKFFFHRELFSLFCPTIRLFERSITVEIRTLAFDNSILRANVMG